MLKSNVKETLIVCADDVMLFIEVADDGKCVSLWIFAIDVRFILTDEVVEGVRCGVWVVSEFAQ